MSTQKAKFELFARLQALGFTYDESAALRRIEMTLQRWGEQECGDCNYHGSWAIERDETTGKPFMVHHHYLHGRGKDYVTRTPMADREAGALKRARAIVDVRNARWVADDHSSFDALIVYHQGDPRGCALYLVRKGDLCGPYVDGKPSDLPIDQYYTRGLAVCA